MDCKVAEIPKIARYRDYFDLQMHFAEAVSGKMSISIADAVLLYTNFHRRMGLGDPPEGAPGPVWQEYAQKLDGLGKHQQRTEWTQVFYAQAPEEQPAFPNQVFGCFDCHADAGTGIVRIHFYKRDADGPLRQAGMNERRRELEDMFVYLNKHYPAAREVHGRSWLYGTEAYRRLFPQEYVHSPAVIEGDRRFQGMSRWGQFLDHKGGIKPLLKEAFLRNIDRLNIERLWEAFPLPSFRVSAPIEVFHDHYGITGSR
jgi:hypothetical protein